MQTGRISFLPVVLLKASLVWNHKVKFDKSTATVGESDLSPA